MKIPIPEEITEAMNEMRANLAAIRALLERLVELEEARTASLKKVKRIADDSSNPGR